MQDNTVVRIERLLARIASKKEFQGLSEEEIEFIKLLMQLKLEKIKEYAERYVNIIRRPECWI
ncbi:hypothetical protein J7J81_02710 [bacterium]|nr:hypothetical protein [bacterium]